MKYAPHLALVAICMTPFANAQISDAFIGTKGNFLKSSFCTKQMTCAPAGTVQLSGYVSSEEYYSVKPKQKQVFGLATYTVLFTRDKDGAIARAGIRYPPAQDYVEDGNFAQDFFSFVGGVPLHAIDGIDLQSQCYWSIRGKTKYFTLWGTALGLGGLGEQLMMMVEDHLGENLFSELSLGTRVVPGKCE